MRKKELGQAKRMGRNYLSLPLYARDRAAMANKTNYRWVLNILGSSTDTAAQDIFKKLRYPNN